MHFSPERGPTRSENDDIRDHLAALEVNKQKRKQQVMDLAYDIEEKIHDARLKMSPEHRSLPDVQEAILAYSELIEACATIIRQVGDITTSDWSTYCKARSDE